MLVEIGNKSTRENIAACAAVGASFWSGSTFKGCVWAVRPSPRPDVDNEFVLVKINRAARTAVEQGTYGGESRGKPWISHATPTTIAVWDTTPEMYVDPAAPVLL